LQARNTRPIKSMSDLREKAGKKLYCLLNSSVAFM